MDHSLRVISVIAVLVCLGGCATSRSNVLPEVENVQNPTQGTAVKIADVTDLRLFEQDPRQPDIPSLSGNDIQDPALTARAIARKRNGFGMALGDVLLPEGRTVSELFRQAVTQSFRHAGYRVLASEDPGYDQAVPVQVKIKQYWSWFRPGFWAVTVSSRAEAQIEAPLAPLANGALVKSEVSDSMQAVFESDWRDISAKGLAGFVRNLQDTLAKK